MSTIARSASRRLGELLAERAGLSPEQVVHAPIRASGWARPWCGSAT